jgi:hypothetical protein
MCYFEGIWIIYGRTEERRPPTIFDSLLLFLCLFCIVIYIIRAILNLKSTPKRGYTYLGKGLNTLKVKGIGIS